MEWPTYTDINFFLLEDNSIMAYAEQELPKEILDWREPYFPFGKHVCRIAMTQMNNLPRKEMQDTFSNLFHIKFDARNDIPQLLGAVVNPTGDIALARHAHILPSTRARCLEILLAARFLAFQEGDIRDADLEDNIRLLEAFANLGNGLVFEEKEALSLLRQSFLTLPGAYEGIRWLNERFLAPAFLPPACESEKDIYGWTIVREENAYYWRQNVSELVPDMAFSSSLTAFLTLEEWLCHLARRGVLPDECLSAYELREYASHFFSNM